MSEELKEQQAAEQADTEAVQSEESAAVNETKPDQKPKKSIGREILEWVLTIVAALAIAFVIRTLIFEPVKVDGASMNDTLVDGEIMVVTKFNYSTASIPFVGNYALGKDPSRFDVIICHYPGRGNTNFVKRVIGLPGDTVALQEGYAVVNGEQYKEPYINDQYRTRSPGNGFSYDTVTVPAKGDVIKVSNGTVTLNGQPVDESLYYFGVYDASNRLVISGGTLFLVNEEASIKRGMPVGSPVTADTEITIAEDNFFVMGDHRNNSNDSRAQGAITRRMIVGQVAQVVWPVNRFRPIPNGLNVK